MGNKKSKGSSKKGNSKKRREKRNKDNISKQEEVKSQKVANEYVGEANIQGSEEEVDTDLNISKASSETSPTDTKTETNTDTDINDYCEEIKANQQKISNRVKDLSVSLTEITLIRDNVNSLRVDNLTEIYFVRQVRPLLDALNIISFATSNMSNAATDFQTNAFADKKEIKNALKLSYKMNDEVDDIITALDRRLKIFLNEINKMDKNCPPFDFNKDS